MLVALEPATWRAFARVYRPLGERVRNAVADLPHRDREAVVRGLDAMAGAFAEAREVLDEV